MSGLIVTPQIVRRIEDNLRYLLVSSWARREKNLWWRRVMKTRSSSTKKELLQWMLETAQIRPMGNGGRYTYDDLVEVFWEIINEDFGAALNLTSDEISDGEGLDRSGKWGKHIGNSGAYWPQGQATYLLKNGKKLLCYDGQPFFSKTHPVNPYIGAASGVYPNLFTGIPFSPEGLAQVYAQIEAIVAPDGIPRHLQPKIVAAGPDLRYPVTQALGAGSFTDPLNAVQGAAATNIIKTSYGFEPPIIAPEFDELGVWYLFCELIEDDELAGLIYQERAPYALNIYAPMTDPELGRLDAFEWQLKGRNAASYGHPFLTFRIEPT
jgi:phage major head subunit gpT-like protein